MAWTKKRTKRATAPAIISGVEDEGSGVEISGTVEEESTVGQPVVRARLGCAVTATEERLSASSEAAETLAAAVLSLLKTDELEELLEVASGDWDAG